MTSKENRGGPGRGQGRKPVAEGQQTVTVSLRMTEAQRDKLALLGGAEWVRQRIDKAKAPNAVFEERIQDYIEEAKTLVVRPRAQA